MDHPRPPPCWQPEVSILSILSTKPQTVFTIHFLSSFIQRVHLSSALKSTSVSSCLSFQTPGQAMQQPVRWNCLAIKDQCQSALTCWSGNKKSGKGSNTRKNPNKKGGSYTPEKATANRRSPKTVWSNKNQYQVVSLHLMSCTTYFHISEVSRTHDIAEAWHFPPILHIQTCRRRTEHSCQSWTSASASTSLFDSLWPPLYAFSASIFLDTNALKYFQPILSLQLLVRQVFDLKDQHLCCDAQVISQWLTLLHVSPSCSC